MMPDAPSESTNSRRKMSKAGVKPRAQPTRLPRLGNTKGTANRVQVHDPGPNKSDKQSTRSGTRAGQATGNKQLVLPPIKSGVHWGVQSVPESVNNDLMAESPEEIESETEIKLREELLHLTKGLPPLGDSTKTADSDNEAYPSENRLLAFYQYSVINGHVERQTTALKDLGKFYFNKGAEGGLKLLLESTALYNAALTQCEDPGERKQIGKLLREIEQAILGTNDKKKGKDGPTVTLPRRGPLESAKRHKEILENLRNYASQQLLRIQLHWALLIGQNEASTSRRNEQDFRRECQMFRKRLKGDLRGMLTAMVKECTSALGTVPCPYAVVTLGELAAETSTPYSDVELMILIDEDCSQAKEYFSRLAVYLQFKVINLGETPLSSSSAKTADDMYFPELSSLSHVEVPNGIKLDKGSLTCKLKHDYQVLALDMDNPSAIPIRTTQDLLKSLASPDGDGVAHYVFHCLQSCVVCGDADLLQQVKHGFVTEYFHKPEKRLVLFEHIVRGKLDDLEPIFQVTLSSFNMHFFEIERDLQLMNYAVQTLHVLYGLQAAVPSRILEEMYSRLILSESGEHDLQMAISIAHTVQCLLHCHSKGQNIAKKLLIMYGDGKHIGFDQIRELLIFRRSSMLKRLYSALIPLANKARSIIEEDKISKMGDVNFMQYDHCCKLITYHRTLQDGHVVAVLKQKAKMVSNQDGDLDATKLCKTYIELAIVSLNNRDFTAARNYLTKVLDMRISITDPQVQTLFFSVSWFHLGVAYMLDNDVIKAEDYLQESLAMFDKETINENCDIQVVSFHVFAHTAMSLLNKWTGKYSSGCEHARLALHYHKMIAKGLPIENFILLQEALADMLLLVGDFKSAHYHSRLALSAYCKRIGFNKSSVLRASLLSNLGVAICGLGRPLVSQYYFTAARREIIEVLGPETDIHVEPLETVHGRLLSSVTCGLHTFSLISSRMTNTASELVLLDKLMQLKNQTSGRTVLTQLEVILLTMKKGKLLFTLNQLDDANTLLLNCQRYLKQIITKTPHNNSLVLECKRLLAMVLCNKGDLQESMQMLRAVITNAKAALDDNQDTDLLQMQALEDQARVYVRRNEYDNALILWQSVLDQRKNIYGQSHPSIAHVFMEMGKLHKVLCDFDSAIGEFNKALYIYEKVYNERVPSVDMAEVCLQLGISFQEAGRLSHAESFLLKSFNNWVEIRGGQGFHPETITTCMALGNLYIKLNNPKDSIIWNKRALQLTLTVDLSARPDVPSLNKQIPEIVVNLSSSYQQSASFADAITCYELALALIHSDASREQNNLQLAKIWTDLGKAYVNIGDQARCDQCQDQASYLRQETLEEETQEVDRPNSLSLLAEHFESRGQYKKSLPLRRKALSQAKSTHGNRVHPEVIHDYKMLIDVYINMEYFGQAGQMNKELLHLFTKKYGTNYDHVEIAWCYRIAGLVSNGLSQFEKSAQNYETSLAMYERLGVYSHGNSLVMTLTEFAKCLLHIGQQQKAEDYLKRAKHLCSTLKKGDAPCQVDIEAEVFVALGSSYECHPKFPKALTSYTKALKLYNAYFGKDTINLKRALCLCGLGRTYCMLGDYRKGILTLQQTVDMFTELFGDGPVTRSDVMNANCDLANAHLKGGDPKTSLELFTKILDMAKQRYGTESVSLQIAKHLGFVAYAAQKSAEHDTAVQSATEALEIYRKVLKKHGNHPDIAAMITLLGDVCMETKQPDKALKHYKDAAHIDLFLHNGNALSKEVEAAMIKVRGAREAIENAANRP